MEKLAEKLDSYDILNNLLPGIRMGFPFWAKVRLKVLNNSFFINSNSFCRVWEG